MPIISFKKVTKVYPPDVAVLQDVSFDIEPGEFVSIVGKSGAGKTTLSRLLLGLEHPTAGDVIFKGINIREADTQTLQQIRRSVGAVYQDYKLLPTKTVYENVAYIMQVEGKENAEIEAQVPKVLSIIGLKDKQDNFPHELSGGEQQRLAIARAIVNQPEIVVADEPTGNLDPYNSYEVMSILQKIHQAGKTVLLATHDRDLVNKISKRVITLEDGKIIRDEAQGKFIL